jgi:hypothetical protein
VLLQHPDDLIFREPCSLHLSVLQRPDSKSPWRKISVAGQLDSNLTDHQFKEIIARKSNVLRPARIKGGKAGLSKRNP